MELRIWSLCGFFVALAVVSHCSVEAHVMERRNVDDDDFLGDEGIDDEAQKDEGNDTPIKGVIQTEGQEFNVQMGQSVRLPCIVIPETVPVVTWDKINGDEVDKLYFHTMKMMKVENPLYNKTEINSEGGVHDLVINNLTASDSGEYRCQLPQEVPTFVVHRIKVGPRIVSLTATGGGTVTEGSDLVLTCKVEGLPPAKILWSRIVAGSNGSNERLGEQDGEFTLDSITIRNVRGHDSGRYYCYALNQAGNTQKEIYVTVLEKPHAHVHKTEINTGIGVHAVFQCTARGTPLPQITWFKDNVPVLVENKRFMISTDGAHSNLTVVPAGANDFGTYSCVAQNHHGVHNRSAELVQRPVVDDVTVDGPRLAFAVHSHLPLQLVEVQLIDQTGKVEEYELPLPKALQKSYEFSHEVREAPGIYQAFIRAKNEKDWSRNTDPIKINIEAEPINIQKSSNYSSEVQQYEIYVVSLGFVRYKTENIYLPNQAYSVRYSEMLISTVFMYLLIRML